MNITNQTFGRWTVLEPHPDYNIQSGKRWKCLCICGAEKYILQSSLRSGLSTSCGCLNKEILVARRLDHTGKKFGRWTAISFDHSDDGAHWLFRCDCGTEKVLYAGPVVNGRSLSCGCYNAEQTIKNQTTHGKSKTSRAYSVWEGIKQRCLNPKTKQYKDYGGRGITICEKWKNSFETFFEDMGEPSTGMTIERINNDLGYCPENCKWATRAEQAENRRPQINEKMITYNGITQNPRGWASAIGISYRALIWRLNNWNNIKRILTP